MRSNWKRSLGLCLALLMTISLVLVGCSKSATPTPAPTQTTAGGETTPTAGVEVTPTPVPSAPVKISVMQWDRGNAPAGWSQDNAWLYRFAKEENLKQYVDVEFVMTPRSNSDTNIKTLYAAQSNPTIIYSYEFSVMTLFADEGGLWALDGYADLYAADLKTKNQTAYDQTSDAIYKGHEYFVPGMRTQPYAGAAFVIREDWLNELSLPMPTNTDELYSTLLAFRDNAPGVSTKETVVPWALQAPNGWYLYHMSEVFGMSSLTPNTGFAEGKGGVINADGTFTPAVLSENFKELLVYLNNAFKDGLVDKELITDTSGERYNMHFARSVAGFTEHNNDGWYFAEKGVVADPNTKFVTMQPFTLKDGNTASVPQNSALGMFLMIPKATATEDQMIAALKYLNWQSSVGWEYVLNGVEGEHFVWADGGYRMVDYDKISVTEEQRAIDLWSNSDMLIVQQGQGYESLEVMEAKNLMNFSSEGWQNNHPGVDPAAAAKYAAEEAVNKRTIHETYGIATPLSMEPRPAFTDMAGDVGSYITDGIVRCMMSNDLERDYAELVEGYKSKGGMEISAEAETILRGWGFIN